MNIGQKLKYTIEVKKKKHINVSAYQENVI